MIHSKKYSINWTDTMYGLLMAAGSAALGSLLQVLNAGQMPSIVTLKTALIAGISGGGFYMMKTFFKNSDGKLATEPKNEIK